VRARAHDATRPLRDGEADFDGVLVDAPCSGLGTWGRNPDARWRSGPDAVAGAARRQRALLAAAARAVRPGGRLVYSVCTLTGAETAQIADAFAGAHAGFAPDPFPPPLGGDAPPADRCGIGPWEGPCAGMFIARWLRT
jgi:16S rRNA (cytosine967-C5)-methyltransferase